MTSLGEDKSGHQNETTVKWCYCEGEEFGEKIACGNIVSTVYSVFILDVCVSLEFLRENDTAQTAERSRRSKINYFVVVNFIIMHAS